MTKRRKYGWTAKGIVGMIFSPLGFFLPWACFFTTSGLEKSPEIPGSSFTSLAVWELLFSLRGWGRIGRDTPDHHKR